jgi:segregation and condensation protein B
MKSTKLEEAQVAALHVADESVGVDFSSDDAHDLEPRSERASEEPVADTSTWLKGLLEAVLFVSDRPLTVKELARAARIDKKRTEELLAELRTEIERRGIRIDEVAGGYAFRSNPIYAAHVRHFLAQRPVRLSRAQLETLSIVAYRQPITRPEIDEIRGVDSGPVLKGLLERDLIKILGKKDEPGRPMLYGTTQAFLELFSMQSLRDLPTLKEFTELSEDSRRAFERETGEEAPEGPVDLGSEPPSEAPESSQAVGSEENGTQESEARAASEPDADEPASSEPADRADAAGETSNDDEDDDDDDDEDDDDEDDDDDDDDEDDDDDDEDDDED